MKNEWTEQDLRQFVESSRPVFQDVSLTQVDEEPVEKEAKTSI